MGKLEKIKKPNLSELVYSAISFDTAKEELDHEYRNKKRGAIYAAKLAHIIGAAANLRTQIEQYGKSTIILFQLYYTRKSQGITSKTESIMIYWQPDNLDQAIADINLYIELFYPDIQVLMLNSMGQINIGIPSFSEL